MKIKNKIISIFMCLCLAVLPGCSQDGGGEPVTTPAATPANTSAAENTDNGESSSTTASGSEAVSEDAAATAPEETEPEDNTPENNLYAYRDLLNEEYEKCGQLYVVSNPLILKDKIIFSENNNNVTTLQVYDITKKQLSKNFDIKFEIDSKYIYFADIDDGYFYVFDGYWENDYWGYSVLSFCGNITKYDTNGNILNKVELKDEHCYLSDLKFDGTLFTYSNSDSCYTNYMYSSDWKTKVELPSIQVDVGHGLTENVTTYTTGIMYNNKLLVRLFKDVPYDSSYENPFYYINTDTMTYEKYEKYENSFNYTVNLIGKYEYAVFKENGTNVATIYDREKDDVLDGVRLPVIVNSDLSKLYGVGEYSYIGGELYRFRYPSDGSDGMEIRKLGIKKDKNAQIYAVNGEYYLYEDQYGYFLRTYEGGEDGEITLMLFEN